MTNVLLVEDDRNVSNALSMRLEHNGFDVSCAYDASTAAMVARRDAPDIAVLDINMPGGDGFLVAERIRKQAQDLPIVFVTASSKPEMREKALAIGAHAFLEKPFSSDELLEALASAI